MEPFSRQLRLNFGHGSRRAISLGTCLITATLLTLAPAVSAARSGPAIERVKQPASKSSAGRDTAADAPRVALASGRATRAAVGATTVQYDAAARKATLRVDDGHELDQYLYADSSPLTFDIDLRGIKLLAGEEVPLTMRVYDVDQAGAPGFDECAVEVDNVNVNGTNVGQLSGANSQWSIVSLNIPAGVLTSGVNHVAIDIDVLTSSCWAVQVDWASVELPFAIAQTEAEAKDDVSIKRGKSDDVIPDTFWKRTFKSDGTSTPPIPMTRSPTRSPVGRPPPARASSRTSTRSTPGASGRR